MKSNLFVMASAVWIIIAIFAVINGLFRESFLVPSIGQKAALPVSGIILSFIIFIVTYLSFSLFGKRNFFTYFLIGLQWVVMTLLFEFIFGHYVIKKSWSAIFEVFNIIKGDLFVVVLLTSLISPLIVARIKAV